MARNITVRFNDDETVEVVDALSDIIGITASKFICEAVKKEIQSVRARPDFQELLEAERKRQEEKFALLDH